MILTPIFLERKSRSGRVYAAWDSDKVVHTQLHFDVCQHLAEENRRHALLTVAADTAGDQDDSSAPSLHPLTEDDFPVLPPLDFSYTSAQPPEPLLDIFNHHESVDVPLPELSPAEAKKQKTRQHHRDSRRRRRNRDDLARSPPAPINNFRPPKRACYKRVKEALSLSVEFDHEDVPIASTGWVGKAVHPDGKIYTLDELLGPKFNMTYVPASG